MSPSLKEQIEAMFPEMIGPQPRTVIRRIRKIESATVSHGYLASLYVEYSDETIEFVKHVELTMNETNVRLKKSRVLVWEENVSSCPGWFSCEDPFKDGRIK